jgi:hypothetical protein
MEVYMECFRDVFGFYPKEYQEELEQQYVVPVQPLPRFRISYPEHWYIPQSRFEKGMEGTADWKTMRYSPYKRISHFREHLNRLQYCQFVSIPSRITRLVRSYLADEPGYRRGAEVYFEVKRLLKQHDSSQYNEHIHHLISTCTRNYVRIPYEDRMTMCTLFTQLEHAFRHRTQEHADMPLDRKNIFSYYLIIQLMLYLFHCHPNYQLPTLLDHGKRQQYYVFLLTLFAETPLYSQVIHQHFTRKRDCQACCEHQTFLDTDLTILL